MLVQMSVVAVRNRAAHRGEGDIDADYARTWLHDTAALLYLINACDAANDVRTIPDGPPCEYGPAGGGDRNGAQTRAVSGLVSCRGPYGMAEGFTMPAGSHRG